MEPQNTNEFTFASSSSFFDKSVLVKLLIGSFMLAVFFLVLHFRDVRVEPLEVGTKAESYVVAQEDFSFYDEEATVILRQQAVRDIGKIYKLREDQVAEARIEFENFLIYNQDWRLFAESSTFDEIYLAVAAVEKALQQLHFTDSRTLSKLKETKLPLALFMNYMPTDLDEEVVLPSTIWDQLDDILEGELPKLKKALSFVMAYLEGKKWQIVEDRALEEAAKRLVTSLVLPKYTHVRAGSRIIDQGDVVTNRHVEMAQAMKKAMGEQKNLLHPTTLFGSLLMSLLILAVCKVYLRVNYPQIFSSNRKLLLLVSIFTLTLGIAKACEFLILASKNDLIEMVRYPLFVPFAAILLCSLINPLVATLSAGFLTIILTMTLAFDQNGFMIMNLTASIVAILAIGSLRRRKEVFIVCGKAYLACIAVVFSIHFYENTFWKGAILTDVLASGVSLLITAVLVVGLLPLFESLFGIMTEATLMEYADPNHELLRRLMIEAPGSYQHSVVVGNLAESAALAVGANGLFCRIATLYHDIGKLAAPQYFIENQQGGSDLHQLLTPQESAEVIIAHVSEGVALARKNKLPEPFIDIIKEHHGTTLVYYFYHKAQGSVGCNKASVIQEDFRYKGPKPKSRESAIIMIADTFEAASRSLEAINEETLQDLADRLVRHKAEEGQFEECHLTFEELSRIKRTLVQTLIALGHTRIKYPKRENLPSFNQELLAT